MQDFSTPTQVSSAVVLAGGLGTRLRSAVPDLPKPMAPIHDRPFLEHQLDYWIDQGVNLFVLSVGYRREITKSHFGNSYRGARIFYADEEKPLGTGGGLLLAVDMLTSEQPILVMNGDTYFEVPLDELVTFHTQNNSDWTFSLFRTKETKRYMGMESASNGRIMSFSSNVGEKSELLANGGVYLVEPSIFNSIEYSKGEMLSLEDDLLRTLIDSGRRFFGYECKGRFIDIGIPEDYVLASHLLRG